MSTRICLAAAGGGKTETALESVRGALASAPLSNVWVIVPDRNQARAFQNRLAACGTMGARVGTFGDLYAEVLGQTGRAFPITPEPAIRRLIRSAIDEAADGGQIVKLLPIRERPGLVTVISQLFAELKRARIKPESFSHAARGLSPQVEDIAAIYDIYQELLQRLEWSDHEGLGWLAVQALESEAAGLRRFRLIVVDGFDSFNPSQIALIEALEPYADQILLTLTGDLAMFRLAYRRFARTLAALRERLAAEVEVLPERGDRRAGLRHLERHLYELDVPKLAAPPEIAFIEAQNVALEAREALRWIKSGIVRQGWRPDQCAVLARDIALYRGALRHAAREFGLPLRLSCGAPLVSNPAISAILNLLQLPLPAVNWARRPVVDTLRSPYFDLSAFELSAADAAAFDALARSGQVIAGIDQWQEACEVAATDVTIDLEYADEGEEGIRARAGASAWSRLGALLRRLTPPPRATISEYVTWVDELLSPRGLNLVSRVNAAKDTARRDEVAALRFHEALHALTLADALVAQSVVPYEQFAGELRSVVEGSVYDLEDETDTNEGRIMAAEVSRARGVAYRAVAVLGLSEGLFPAALDEEVLLGDQQRAALAERGLPLEPRLRSDQQTSFYEAVTRATDALLLSRPYLAEDGESWEASPFWWAALDLFESPVQRVRAEDKRPHADAASGVELLTWCGKQRVLPAAYAGLDEQWKTIRHGGRVLLARMDRTARGKHEGEVDLGGAHASRYSRNQVWSATGLETYGHCPFYFYVARALSLVEQAPPQPGFDNRQLGSMLHEILERVYREAGDRPSLDSLLVRLEAVAQEVFYQAPRKLGFRPTALWQAQRVELVESLRKTLRGLAADGEQFRPAYFEQKFGRDGVPALALDYEGEHILFGGIIDRVDVDDQHNLRVIDYKTGSSDLNTSDLREGRRLQLAIYALAAERSLELGQAVDGFYWAIRKAEASKIRLRSFHYESEAGVFAGAAGAIELVLSHCARFVRAIRGGAFAPAPSAACKKYCPARLFCWRYAPAPW